MDLDIYRGESINLTKRIDDNTRLIRQLLGADIIKSTFNSRDILDIDIGDYIIYNSINYYINNLPNIKKNATNSFDYTITFESEYYELLKTQFMDADANSDFNLMGNLETFIDLIVSNMNREHSGWARGVCDQTNSDYRLLNFSRFNCMQTLQKLCVEFEGEFYFDGKDICFTDKAGSDSGLTFRYKLGLRNIQRTTLSEKNIITRLFAFGSRKNLKSDYRSHTRRLKFVTGGKSYLESNVDKYGTIEHTELFNSIYPHREGTISAVDGADITKFTDSGMDFNLNDYLLPGVTAKLHFNSGNLGGYEFEIFAYNNSTKEFTIIAFKDYQGYEMPNATLKPAIGDKYVLIDIEMPQSYIDTAETALQAKAQTYLDDNDDPRVTYILTPDPRYFKIHTVALEAGDFITIVDTDLEIDILTRIVELTKSVADQYKYTLKLTDHLEVQLIQRLYSEQEDIKKKIETGDVGNIYRAWRNWKTSEELRTMIFDTDGYFDMGNIRPASIETGMLSVGSKSTQYILKEILIEGNYTGDKTKFYASAGELIHLSIADEIRTWTISENSQDSLEDNTAYYIYAKCTKEPGYTGQIVVDEVQRKFDDDATYYYFLIGVLHSVVDGIRGISLTYGQTIVHGGFLQANTITADKYNELRNTIVFSGDDSLDATHPCELDFEIVSEMTAIVDIRLSFRIEKFRAYSKAGSAAGTPSGGSSNPTSEDGGSSDPTSSYVETPSGGADTSGITGGNLLVSIDTSWGSSGVVERRDLHRLYMIPGLSGVYRGSATASVADSERTTHRHYMSNHFHTTPNHVHPTHSHTVNITAHSHVVNISAHIHSNHSHPAVYGIFEEDTSPTINIFIADDGINYGDSIGAYGSSQLDIDITAHITGTGFKRIKFESNLRTRISSWVLCKIDLTA